MSFSARLVHSLAIVTPTRDVDDLVDDYGQPVPGEPTVTVVRGLVQPKAAREVALLSQAGPVVADHRIFLARSADPTGAAYIRFEPDDGDRYEIVGVQTFDFGRTPHHEVDARRVVSAELVAS